MARVWLHQLGVAFEERDVYGVPGTAEELRALHVVRLPALRVGQQVVAGFDRARWLQAIAVAGECEKSQGDDSTRPTREDASP